MHVTQVYKIGDGKSAVAMAFPVTSFLSESQVVEDDYCIVVLNNKVREENQEAFKELLTDDDSGGNCIMSVPGGNGSGTIAEQRNAVFNRAGPDIYKRGARFL
jgi:hypothetical protein